MMVKFLRRMGHSMSQYGMALMLSASSISLFAQGTTEKVTVTTPGTLIELVSDLESSRIYSLKVEGALNAADLSYIGGESGKIKTVKELDLSDITLVSGSEPYKKYTLRNNDNGLLGNTTATFFISDTARIESKVVDTALGGQSTLQNVYGKNLAGLFAGCGYEKVVLPSNLTSIGYAAFFGANAIQEMTVPSSVHVIENDAFYSATNLKKVDLPSALKKIGYDSFSKTGLTEATLPASLDSICGRAFMGTPLTSIDLRNVKHVGFDCFSGCRLEGMLDVSNLDCISEGAFAGNIITGIIFSNKLTEIQNEAFYSNKQLQAISLPEGLKTIGDKAFYDCRNLSSVEVPTTLENIGYQAFDMTEWNRNLKGENGVVYLGSIAYAYDYDSAQDPSILEFKEGTTVISSCFQIESISDGYGNYFYPKEDITTIIFPSTLKRIEGRDNGYSSGVFSGMVKLGDIVLNEGLEYIGDSAFAGCGKMWFDKLPSSLKHIGLYAFRDCNGLTEITLSNGLEYLGYNAFQDCKGLYSIKYNCNIENTDKLSYYSGGRFSGCEGLYQIVIGKDVILIPEGMFSRNGLQKVVFDSPEARKAPIELGVGCFSETQIKTLDLPAVDVWKKDVFSNCKVLETIFIDGDCNIIKEHCADRAPIQEVRINGKVGKIEGFAFGYNNNQLKTFFAQSCDTIGSYAFYRNWSIENIDIPDGVRHVGEGAFYECKSLEGFPFKPDMTFEAKAFAQTNLKEVSLGEKCTVIPAEAFRSCKNLEKVTFAIPPVEVGEYAFSGCNNLSSFDFSKIKKIGEGAFGAVSFGDMPELYLPDGFSDLGAGAFSKANFELVSLPISLLTISERAFQDAGRFNLKWRIPEDYEYDGNSYNVIYNAAFRSALTNTEVIVPEGVNEIRDVAFNNNNIKTISLPSTLQILFANALQKGEGGTVETIYCLAKTPPSVDTSYLLDRWVDNIFKGVIYVPAESLTRYRQNGFWGKYNIQPIPVDVSGVSLSAGTVALKEGETYQLIATVEPSDATDKSLEWTSSDESVASVSANGLVTAINEGTAIITVSASNGIAASCVVTVETRIVEMEAVILNVAALALEVGDTYQLIATAVPEDTTYPELEWWSDDEKVAVVDQNGLVTVIGEGETLIRVRSAVWSHVEAECRINAVADVRGIICDDQPCDIYSFSGELLRKDAPVSEMDHLRKGVYIICQGMTRIKLIK